MRQLRQPRALRFCIDLGAHEFALAAERNAGWCEKHCPRLRLFAHVARRGTAAHAGTRRHPYHEETPRPAVSASTSSTASRLPCACARGGERLQPDARRPRRSLKNLLQEARMPPGMTRPSAAFVQRRCAGLRARYRNRRRVSSARSGERAIAPVWQADCLRNAHRVERKRLYNRRLTWYSCKLALKFRYKGSAWQWNAHFR